MSQLDWWFLILYFDVFYQDHSRYSAGRGAHINLKRAERARITVTKIPGTLFFSSIYQAMFYESKLFCWS